MSTPFQKFITLRPEARKIVQDIVSDCYPLGLWCKDWRTEDILPYKILTLLKEPNDKIEEEDLPAVKWNLGAFVVTYKEKLFLATTYCLLNAFQGIKRIMTMSDINSMFIEDDWRMCSPRMSDEVFLRTVFVKFGAEARKKLRFRFLPKKYNPTEHPYYRIQPCLSAPLEEDK
jgi:hypothetical protein